MEEEKKKRGRKKSVEHVVLSERSLRDHDGLLKSVNYVFDSVGFINWRAMIPKEHIVLNRSAAAKLGINLELLSDDDKQKYLDEWSDDKKVVKLSGFREIARLRGFESVDFKLSQEGQKVVCSCTIDWIPNFENKGFSYTGVASASPESVGDKVYVKFLEAIAANRAFCRAVRESLNIYITSDEELDSTEKVEIATASSGPVAVLRKKCEDKGISFESIKKLLEGKGLESDEWVSWATLSIPAAVEALNEFKKDEQ